MFAILCITSTCVTYNASNNVLCVRVCVPPSFISVNAMTNLFELLLHVEQRLLVCFAINIRAAYVFPTSEKISL